MPGVACASRGGLPGEILAWRGGRWAHDLGGGSGVRRKDEVTAKPLDGIFRLGYRLR
jgi:hypothetical protein